MGSGQLKILNKFPDCMYVYVCMLKSKQGSLCGLKSLSHHHRLRVHQQSHLISQVFLGSASHFKYFLLKEITNLSQQPCFLSFPAQGNLLTNNDKGCFGFKKRIRITYKYTIRIKQTSGGFSHIYVYVCRWKSKQGSLCGLKSLRHHHRLKVHQQSHLIS